MAAANDDGNRNRPILTVVRSVDLSRDCYQFDSRHASILQLPTIRRRTDEALRWPFAAALPTHRLIYNITAASDLRTGGDLGRLLRTRVAQAAPRGVQSQPRLRSGSPTPSNGAAVVSDGTGASTSVVRPSTAEPRRSVGRQRCPSDRRGVGRLDAVLS